MRNNNLDIYQEDERHYVGLDQDTRVDAATYEEADLKLREVKNNDNKRIS